MPVGKAFSTTNSTDQHSVHSQSKKRVKDEKQVEEETELLSHLDQSKLNKIKDLFGEDGLQLNEFLEVMLENLDFAKSEELKITMRLIDLFKEIDVNGDETLEWHEFSNHIIELGMLKKDRTVKEIIKNYYEDFPTSLRPKHDEDIEKVYYFEELKNIIAIEKKSKKFQVYSYANPTLLCDVQAHRGEIVAAELVKVQGTSLLATTAVDLAINFWDTQTFKLKQIISTPDIQQVLRYARWGDTANDPELLYTGGNDAIIHVYDLRNFRERSILPGWNPFLKRDADQKGHSGPVMDILPIKEQKILASAALDGRICLWDAATEKNFETLGGEGAHLKGITCLDWHAENSWLLSCGLDHDVFVFNTYVQEKIYTLKGHAHPLVGVKCVPGTYQLVTADIKGMVKIWDIRTMLCCQSFNATDQLNSFCVTYPKKRIVIGSKTLSFYDYDEPKDQYLSDEKSCLRVIYNETLFMFITLHLDTVKVWDAKDGQLKATHRGLTRGEFTSCCLDDRERKLLICDTQGNIIAINVRNGATLKKFHSHRKAGPGKDEKEGDTPAGPVTDIGYCKVKSKLKVAITSSDLATLKIHDDSESDPTKSRNNEMSHHKKAINCIAIRPAEEKVVETISMLPLINQKPGGASAGMTTKKAEVQITEETGGYTLPAVVASGGEDGLIMVTNLASYRIEAQLKSEGEKPFKKVIWLGTHDVLVGADNEGRIYFYGYLEDRKFDLHCITEYRSASQTSHSKDEITPVSALGYDKDRNLLVLGDVFGNVEIWNVTKIVDKAQRNKRFLKNKFGKKQQTSAYDSSGRPVKNESMFLTETVITSLDKFTKDDVVIRSTKRRSHLDGITHIDVISQHRAYATSSYDCCVLVWSIDKQEKLGALLLGRPAN